MQKLIVSVAIAVALGSAIGCTGDTDDTTDDPNQDQAQQALTNRSNRGGTLSSGVGNGATARTSNGASKLPTTQDAFSDPTQQVGDR